MFYSCRSEQAIAWMAKWFHLVGDQMPDSNMTHLPHFLTREAVYQEMRRELERAGNEVISMSHFYATWTANFPRVTIPKVCFIKKSLSLPTMIILL
jgi:hypothetical protein